MYLKQSPELGLCFEANEGNSDHVQEQENNFNRTERFRNVQIRAV